MPRFLTLTGLALIAGLLLLWATGGFSVIEAWALTAQRDIQTTLAGAVRRLRGGQPGALAAFLGVCFAYGVLHAVGPGHGKLLIGSYAAARRVPLRRLSVIALSSSLAQSAVAVALVVGGFAILGWARAQTEAAATEVIAPIGTLAIAGLGLWLIWRGLRGLWAARHPATGAHGQEHDHDHDHVHGPNCNHSHGPTLQQIEGLSSRRDAFALIAGIALRPCSGALVVLILTFQLGIAAAGIAGTFAMGLGTALVTLLVAAAAVWGRESALSALPGGTIARALPLIELAAGSVIALTAATLLSKSL